VQEAASWLRQGLEQGLMARACRRHKDKAISLAREAILCLEKVRAALEMPLKATRARSIQGLGLRMPAQRNMDMNAAINVAAPT